MNYFVSLNNVAEYSWFNACMVMSSGIKFWNMQNVVSKLRNLFVVHVAITVKPNFLNHVLLGVSFSITPKYQIYMHHESYAYLAVLLKMKDYVGMKKHFNLQYISTSMSYALSHLASSYLGFYVLFLIRHRPICKFTKWLCLTVDSWVPTELKSVFVLELDSWLLLNYGSLDNTH
jgi:hypothetical protein